MLVTPAFPETGRTVYRGHLFVGAVPLNESPLKDHPLNPMRDPNLVRVLQRQSKDPVGLVALPTVAEGGAAIARRLAELEREGCGAAIVDAVFERDLEAIGEAAARGPVSVGASGLGLGLARALARDRGAAANAGLEPVGGLAAVLTGSCSRATLDQIAAAERDIPTLRVSPQRLIEDESEAERAIAWAQARLAAGPVPSPPAPSRTTSPRCRRGSAARPRAARIEAALAGIAAGLVAIGVRQLVVAGGETAGAAVDRLGVRAFRLGPEIAPGVPLMRTIGRDSGEMQMALKSGNFGGRDFFARALAMTR